ncbi:MAG: hypothetical protein PHV99_02920 [Candidatus Pacebacteria bacterium]|nr:hypothetical protein [Candidatus Paceibacterota bacterium]
MSGIITKSLTQLATVDPAVVPEDVSIDMFFTGTPERRGIGSGNEPRSDKAAPPRSPPTQLTAEADALGGAAKNAAGAISVTIRRVAKVLEKNLLLMVFVLPFSGLRRDWP